MSTDYYIPPRIQRSLMAMLDGQCAYCGWRQASEFDHIIPRCQGGTDDPANLVPTCHACNYAKSGRTLVEWFSDIGTVVQDALLQRFDEQPLPEPKPPKPTFDELVKQLDTNDPEVCWLWPSDRFRSPQLPRRVYEALRRPLNPYNASGGERVFRCRQTTECVNPDHATIQRTKWSVYD